MDIMRGTIEVESEPGSGTLFRLSFLVPQDPSKQVFFENDSAQLYYDAGNNNTVIIWKKNVSSIEYRKVFEAVLLTIKTYKTPGWIADLRNQGKIDSEDQKWFISTVLQMAYDNGLRKIATIGFHDPIRTEYYNRMVAVFEYLGIEMRVFDSMEKAVAWMTSVHEGNSLSD